MQNEERRDKILPALATGRAELVHDAKGIVGVGFKGPTERPRDQLMDCEGILITRRDRIVPDDYARAALQPQPKFGFFKHSFEQKLTDLLFDALLARSGIDRYEDRCQPGWKLDWGGGSKEQQNARRKTFHGRKLQALGITNHLIRQALTVAEPEALKLARKFPSAYRYAVYCLMARSQRMRQLAETFPALLAGIADLPDHAKFKQVAAIRAVRRGLALKTVADIVEIPLAFRRIKPGAVGIVGWDPELSGLIYAFLPESTAAQRRWLRMVKQAEDLGAPYVEWVGRNFAGLGASTIEQGTAQIGDIKDWVRASYAAGLPKYVVTALTEGGDVGQALITRPFSPDMSVNTVRALSGAWHEDVALSDHDSNEPLPPPWRGATKIDDLDVVPLTTAAELAAEGRHMHHCVATHTYGVRNGHYCIYSVRQGDERIATVEVGRRGDTRVVIEQMRGPCDALLPKPLQAKLNRWAGEKNKWSLPPEEGDRRRRPTDDDDED